ncbi:MAG: PAS domain S-box protein [Theionarchaea archaeon]|nr:PAS domain S-box protein [Theionarchaea archaeon]
MNLLMVGCRLQNCLKLEVLLTERGHTVKTARDGKEALDLLRKECFDGILSAVFMPVLDGFQFCRIVKSTDTLKAIPFIFFAEKGEETDTSFALSLGADVFIEAPLCEEVLSRIENVSVVSREVIDDTVFFQEYNKILKKRLDRTVKRIEEIQEELSRSEKKYQQLFESAHDATFIMNRGGGHIEANKKASELLGYTLEEFRQLSFREIVVPDYIPDSEDKLGKILRGEDIPVYEKKFKAKDGREIPVEISVSGIKNESGEVNYVQSIVRDITERKETEQALQESEMKYRNLVEQAHEGIAIVRGGILMYVNLWWEDMTGYTVDELVNTPFTDYIRSEDLVRVLEHVGSEGVTPVYEALLRHKEGHYFHIEFNAGTTLYQGSHAHLVIVRDISEKKRAEEALSESEKQYTDLFENVPIGVYRSTPEGHILMANPVLVRMLGYSSFEELAQVDLEKEGRAAGYPRSVFKEHIESGGQVTGFESSWVRRDGTTIFFLENARVVRSSEGTTLYYEGTLEDITERKKAEERTRESEEKYRNIVELAPDGIATLDLKGVITSCNTAFLQMAGYAGDEIVGKHFTKLPTVRARDLPTLMRIFSSLLRGKIPPPFQSLWKHEDGSIRLGEIHVGLMRERGTIIGFQAVTRDITQRRQMEELLRLSEEKYRSLIENLNIGVYRVTPGKEGDFVDVNQAFVTMMGYDTEDDILRLKVSDIYFDPQQRMHFSEKMSREGFLKKEELILKKKDGTPIIASDTGKAVRDREGTVLYFEGILEDITERKKAEQELRQYRHHLEELVKERTIALTQANVKLQQEVVERTLMEESLAAEKERLAVTLRSIGDGVITTDTEGTIVLINKAAELLTGYTAEEATGNPLDTVFCIINEQTRSPCKNPVTRVLSQGAVVGLGNNTVLISRDGTERVIADSGAPIRDHMSRIIGVVLVFRDVTEKRKREQELLRTQKLESLGNLAGGIAHDFNNILTGIMNNAALARIYTTDNRAGARLTKIEKASMQARNLTQQLLTFSKGGSPIKKTTSLNKVIRDSTSFALRGSNVRCHFYISDELSPADIDEGQISQVINNLIMNADEAMPEGGVIQVRAENVVVGEESFFLQKGTYTRISIEDQGVGIPEKYLSRIFDPYFTTKQKGSGLGLATAYSIIKRHNGHLNVESEVGVGTTFHIWLPASRDSLKREEIQPHTPIKGEGRILFMDDEETIRDAAREVLTYLGYTVEFAEDGREAIELYKKRLGSQESFDIVIMDLTIPGGMGGKEALSALLEIDPHVKAIVSSGYSTDPIMADFRKYGFKGVVTKPYSIEELSETLNRMMERQI